MSLARAKPVFTAEDYLAWEEHSPDKHQYLAGEIFAMSAVRPTLMARLPAIGLPCCALMFGDDPAGSMRWT